MKKYRLAFSLILCLSGLTGQSTNSEFRSNWVITWEYISSSYSPAQGKARIREILDNMKAAHMNAVLFQVRQSGTAYYPSSFEPWGYYAGSGDPGYNPLAYMIQEAHARGMEVHAWFNVFQASSTAPGTPAHEHPDWVCRDQDGNPMTSYRALSPGLEAVRNYTVNVAMEIVNNYDIDGLHLDYVRWNEYANNQRVAPSPEEELRRMDGMLTDEEIEALNENRSGRYLYDIEHPYSAGVPSGFATWEEWWRSSVTEFVSTLHDSIQTVKPWVRLSAAVLGKYNWSGWQAYGSVFQDAALWFNEHYVDQLTPMHYHWTSSTSFYGMLVGDCPNCWSDYIQPGIEEQNIYTVGPGSYVLSDNGAWNNHASIVNTCRSIPWVKGFQFFSYGTWESHDYWNQAGSTFFKRQTKQPVNFNVNSNTPEAPTLSLERVDSLNYRLTITPLDTTNPAWYIVYRTDTLAADSSQNTIVDIHFSDTTYQIMESFSGTQDFNGRYTYYATTANRYWSESSPSSLETTDSIPSFAPMVVSTDPPAGDTVRVNVRPEIIFSKTMNTDDTYSKIIVDTEIGYSLIWASNHRSVAISFYQNLPYALDFTITIDSSLTDINGVEFDGNGDGQPGDALVLHYTTEAQDIWGPEIAELNLDFNGLSDQVEIGDVVTIVFDERVSPSSLGSGVDILANGLPIDFDHHYSELNEQSLFSIRPADDFIPDQTYTVIIDSTITDIMGNPMDTRLAIDFHTEALAYGDILMISEFDGVAEWWQPSGSGSTTGILAETSFGTSSSIYLPGTTPRKSAKLHYAWNTNANDWLIRTYLSGGDPRAVQFDTSYILQTYLYGDGSSNYFRFCVDDRLPATAAGYHEVSPWIEINWKGWRLVSWDLGVGETGTWLGDGVLEGTMRTDSFQMTYNPTIGVSRGTIYFDNYRAVRKTDQLATEKDTPPVPVDFALYQNYPNPFNPQTAIRFDLDRNTQVSLVIYDLMGREVRTLIKGYRSAGTHMVSWSGRDNFGKPVATGTYFCRLRTENQVRTIRMVLLK